MTLKMTLKVIFSDVLNLYEEEEEEDEEKKTLKITLKVIFSVVSILYEEEEEEDKKNDLKKMTLKNDLKGHILRSINPIRKRERMKKRKINGMRRRRG